MQSVNTYYVDDIALKTFIDENHIFDSSQLLIQVFTANNDEIFIQALIDTLVDFLPQATLIGSTTDGEIMSGKVSTGKTVLSFTLFEYTTFKTHAIAHQADGYFSGKSLAERIIGEDTKLVIAFTDGLHSNGEAFLDGIYDVNSSVMIAGGLAGDNATFKQTYVFTKDAILGNGAVAVSLNSKVLKVRNDYSFNWRCIGKPLTITKVEGNRVYKIDQRTAVDTYIHYLGKEMAAGLPAVGIAFPLILIRDGITIARAVLGKHRDGSLVFAGNFKEGEKVQFGYGDAQAILQNSTKVLQDIEEKRPEAIFIYSCMARRHFMPDIIESETLPMEYTAPVSGFFTYGEFFTSKKPELLNQSMTLITLSEYDRTVHRELKCEYENTLSTHSSTNALIHLLNVTSQEAMEQSIHIEAQNIFEKLFQASPDGIVLIENDTFIQCNQTMLDIFGYQDKERFLRVHPLSVSPQKQPDGEYSIPKLKKMKRLAIEKGSHHFEWVYKKANGEHFWADIMLTHIVLNGRETIYVVCRDISERKELELELARQKNILYYKASHDELTGLPNRALFMEELSKSLHNNHSLQQGLVVMFIDLDRFKKINDSLGHTIGDKVISVAGERIKLCLQKNDLIARLGGDEFVVMLREVESDTAIETTAEKILQITRQPICIEHYTLYISASIGISRYPVDDMDGEHLLKYADTAMYKAKEEGGNNYQFYTKKMTDMAIEHVMMEKDLREGIYNGDFEVYYQPQINAKTKEIIGVEALVRWNHPIEGLLVPDIFIPLSEKTGLIIELDLWVMKRAMSDMAKWYSEGLNPGRVSLNVSMKQLEYPHLQKVIEENMHTYHFNYEWLELEITETEVMKNPHKVIDILDSLHQLGIRIAIDDFGTGYSSLSHLKRLPIDKLKIDKLFIADIVEDETALAIVNTMIVLGESLQLDVIAEGVEDEAQQNVLLDYGCYYTQGYYYSEPVNATKMRQLLMHGL